MTPHRCPICSGNGLVAAGFYNQISSVITGSSTAFETCRSCDGKGVVWEPVNIFAQPVPVKIAFTPQPVEYVDTRPCTCPPPHPDGSPYIGDTLCEKHKTTVICEGVFG